MTTEPRESIPTGDTGGGLIMPRSESPRAAQGGQIQMRAGRPSGGGTVTFEGEYATITFERSIRHPIGVVWEALTESEHLARWYLTRARLDARAGGSIDYSSGPAQCQLTAQTHVWQPPRAF